MAYLQSENGKYGQTPDQRPYNSTSATAYVNYLLLYLQSLTAYGRRCQANHRQTRVTAATALKKKLRFLAIPSVKIKKFLQSLSFLVLFTLAKWHDYGRTHGCTTIKCPFR